jgi:hypothetical protein
MCAQQARHFIMRLLRAGQRSVRRLNCGVRRRRNRANRVECFRCFQPIKNEANVTTIVQAMKVLVWRQDRLETMLTRLRWPLPGHIGSKWLDDVADSYLAGILTDQDVVDVLLDKYMKHGLHDVRLAWRQDALIADRLPILLDALEAHEQQRYTLSVPVFLAQLEGLIATAKRHKGRFTRKSLVQYLESIRSSGSRFSKVSARL